MVDEVLLGQPGHLLSLSWDNSTFGEPKSLPSGPFLIALRDPHSRIPPLRAVSATVSPNPELGALTLLQAPCARPFLFSVDRRPICFGRNWHRLTSDSFIACANGQCNDYYRPHACSGTLKRSPRSPTRGTEVTSGLCGVTGDRSANHNLSLKNIAAVWVEIT